MLTRRAFLAAGASALTVSGTSWDVAAQGRAVTRRSIRGMGLDHPDIAAYRRAVAAMKALPPSDPRNWIRFADIHRDFCPHANWYFMPWHRAYIASFERLCRDLSGKADFALPYWDWTADRQLPAAVAAGDPQTNPLNHLRSGFARGDSLPEDMVGREVMARILGSPDFEAFGSTRPRGQTDAGAEWLRRPGARTELEFNPHDGIHTTLGGDMAQPSLASRDPIFYLHHANVDRIWSTWNRRGNENSREPSWLDFAFNRHFINPDGSPWNVTVDDLQSPLELGYQYESEAVGYRSESAEDAFAADPVVVHPDVPAIPPGDDALAGRLSGYRRLPADVLPRPTRELRRIALPLGGAIEMAAADNDRAASRDRPLGIAVTLGRPLADVVRPGAMSARTAARGSDPGQRVWAVIRDIEPPADSSTRVRVFVNCGELAPGTPVTHPSYATSLSFFAGRHAGHHGHASHSSGTGTGTSAAVDLTPTLSRIGRTSGIRGDSIVVQLVPVCARGSSDASRVRPRRVEIAII